MKVTGIIAEYNPFHNGHQHHINQAKLETGADYIVVVMSGDFTQRGTPALLSKHVRAKHALMAGADLVLELPMAFATSSAEYFAFGSCALLDSLGVIDTICFGMEKTDLESLDLISSIMSKEPDIYKEMLKKRLSDGYSFPKASRDALTFYDPNIDTSILESPNNRLALEYLKALKNLNSSIKPYPIKRIGKAYDDTDLSTDANLEFSSASSIRKAISDGVIESTLSTHVPEYVWKDLEKHLNENSYLSSDDLNLILHYKLLQQTAESLTTYLDINHDIANKIINNLPHYKGFDSFCMQLKSKDLTYTRISRLLLHVILDLKKSDMESLLNLSTLPYGRILGFKKESTALLHQIKEVSNIPLLSKLADSTKLLPVESQYFLEKDITASHIYEALVSHKAKKEFQNEYTSQIQII